MKKYLSTGMQVTLSGYNEFSGAYEINATIKYVNNSVLILEYYNPEYNKVTYENLKLIKVVNDENINTLILHDIDARGIVKKSIEVSY